MSLSQMLVQDVCFVAENVEDTLLGIISSLGMLAEQILMKMQACYASVVIR
jgi:hypothetical protein